MATKRRQTMQYFSLDHSFVDLAVNCCVRPTGRMGGPGEPGPEDCSGKGCQPETRDRPEGGPILPAGWSNGPEPRASHLPCRGARGAPKLRGRRDFNPVAPGPLGGVERCICLDN